MCNSTRDFLSGILAENEILDTELAAIGWTYVGGIHNDTQIPTGYVHRGYKFTLRNQNVFYAQ